VRDPNVTPNRLIVVMRGAPEFEMCLGRSTLRQSEIAGPEIPIRTVILWWADGRYTPMHDGLVDGSGTAARRYIGMASRASIHANLSVTAKRSCKCQSWASWIWSGEIDVELPLAA
jgi:hypothetical protein